MKTKLISFFSLSLLLNASVLVSMNSPQASEISSSSSSSDSEETPLVTVNASQLAVQQALDRLNTNLQIWDCKDETQRQLLIAQAQEKNKIAEQKIAHDINLEVGARTKNQATIKTLSQMLLITEQWRQHHIEALERPETKDLPISYHKSLQQLLDTLKPSQ